MLKDENVTYQSFISTHSESNVGSEYPEETRPKEVVQTHGISALMCHLLRRD